MAAHCRLCGSLLPREHPAGYPLPERLAELAPFLSTLMECAEEFIAVSADEHEPGTAVEFVTWIAVEVEQAAGIAPRRRAVFGTR
jgi:hypothetical protein